MRMPKEWTSPLFRIAWVSFLLTSLSSRPPPATSSGAALLPSYDVPQQTLGALETIAGTKIAVGPHGSTAPRASLRKLAR